MKKVKINLNVISDYESLADVEQYIKSDPNRVYKIVEINELGGDYPIKLEGIHQGFNEGELIVIE